MHILPLIAVGWRWRDMPWLASLIRWIFFIKHVFFGPDKSRALNLRKNIEKNPQCLQYTPKQELYAIILFQCCNSRLSNIIRSKCLNS